MSDVYIVNAFTGELACGNPAGVVFYNTGIDDLVFQKIAIDIGKSETAFLKKIIDNEYTVRWFTPVKEVRLCGHATLAAAKVIHTKERYDKIKFHYCDGIINAVVDDDESIGLEFPTDNYVAVAVDPIYYDFFGKLRIVEVIQGIKTNKVIIIVAEETDLESINPNYEKMKNATGIYDRGIGISKKSDHYDFETRYFNPWHGVNEDPVTGSVHTVLANYWSKKLGLQKLIALQASFRPGELSLSISGKTVEIKGKAKIVLEGKLCME